MLAYAPHRQEPVILITERPVDLIISIVILMMMILADDLFYVSAMIGDVL